MISFLAYGQNSDLKKCEIIESSHKVTVIAPGPTFADSIRELFSRNANIEVITIAKFIDDNYGKYTQKAELMMKLSVVWKKLFLEEGEQAFFQAFNLFTEIRAFTLDENLVDQFLEHLDENQAKVMKVFTLIMSQLELVDEQEAYLQLSDQFRSMDNVEDATKDRHFIFWGFHFFSSTQIDLIHSLGIRNNVYLPIPKLVYENKKPIDWMSWINADKIEDIEKFTPCPYKKVQYRKGEHNKVLSELIKEETGSPFNIYLTDKNIDLGHYLDIKGDNLFFKHPINLTEDKFQDLFKLIDRKIGADGTAYNVIIEYLDEVIQESISGQNFLMLKSVLIIKNVLIKWKEISEESNIITKFDLSVLKKVSLLQAPRNSFVPIVEAREFGKVGFPSILEDKEGKKSLILVSSDFGELTSQDKRYEENLMKDLAQIGTMRRGELDFLFHKQAIREILQNEDTILLIEEGILESSMTWNSILEGVDFNEIQYLLKPTLRELKRPFRVKGQWEKTKLSATQLQSYIDCPQKYYFNYIEKVTPFITISQKILESELGQIQHDILDCYFKEGQDDLFSLVHKKLKIFLAKNKKKISLNDYKKYFSEIFNFVENGVIYLKKIEEIYSVENFEFEQSFSHMVDGVEHRGSIDCIAMTSDRPLILDFKRSEGSIPSQSAVSEMKKIQLWFYLNHGPEKSPQAMGYISLRNTDESVFFVETKEEQKWLKSQLDCKVKSFNSDFEGLNSDYQSVENEYISQLSKEEDFFPEPADVSACMFCSYKNLCPKTNVEGGKVEST